MKEKEICISQKKTVDKFKGYDLYKTLLIKTPKRNY